MRQCCPALAFGIKHCAVLHQFTVAATAHEHQAIRESGGGVPGHSAPFLDTVHKHPAHVARIEHMNITESLATIPAAVNDGKRSAAHETVAPARCGRRTAHAWLLPSLYSRIENMYIVEEACRVATAKQEQLFRRESCRAVLGACCRRSTIYKHTRPFATLNVERLKLLYMLLHCRVRPAAKALAPTNLCCVGSTKCHCSSMTQSSECVSRTSNAGL